jgi:hypothetical protein
MFLLALVLGAGAVCAQTGGGFDLSWGRANSGASSTGSGWTVVGMAGQADAGRSGSGNWLIQGGFLNRVTANLSPVGRRAAFSRPKDSSLKIRITNLLTNAFDPDGESPAFAGVSATSTNGGTITANSTFVFYSPPSANSNSNVTDQFTYRVKDGFQGLGAGEVSITISNSDGQSFNVLSITTLADGNKQIDFAGIPDRTYWVQAATNLTHPIFWETLSTNTAGSDGLWSYSDLKATNFSSRYYRSAAP